MNSYNDLQEFIEEWKYGNDLNIPVKCYFYKDDDTQGKVVFAQTRKETLVSAHIEKVDKAELSAWWEKAKSKRKEELVVL